MTNEQATVIADTRATFDSIVAYEFGEKIVLSTQNYDHRNGFVSSVIVVNPDGRKTLQTDPLAANYWLIDAQKNGRRI